MKRKSLIFCIIGVLLFSGMASAYVQQDQKERPAETITGTVVSLSGSRIRIESTVSQAVRVTRTFVVTDATRIIGTVAVGATVAITFRREGYNGRYARSVAVTIQVLE